MAVLTGPGIASWLAPWQVGLRLRLIQDPYPFTGPLAWLTGGGSGLGVIQVPYKASCQVEAAPRQPNKMAWHCQAFVLGLYTLKGKEKILLYTFKRCLLLTMLKM